ncbi:putative kinesin [Trypanosoma rangeli]|uniref:Kinesin-like protein n=1 Tax=Trypanosoma rangeli TaxID=5698 RepID=A0A422N2N4_TRYRA|nr:putative kinesin [Trypanosoma rangeli]RNE99703.1 putative kinesin [Trypanosoma rangeli]|eukprot:RNE99703.1 putative kinesin [Trypanosoma rangeli]
MSGTSKASGSSIDVLIRVRPMRAELQEVKTAWDISTSTLREKGNPDNLFTFDHVYGTDAATQSLYERSVRNSIVTNVVKGYNGTVLVYGQTGSGKTYTMLGGSMVGDYNAPVGIAALAVRDLFSDIEEEVQRNPSMQVDVYVSLIEIYNEQLRDLLIAPGAPTASLSIRENEHGVYVHNAVKRQVASARECTQVIHAHVAGRVSASTGMNELSSRSHCVIRILVERNLPVGDASDASSTSSEENGERDECMRRKIVSTLNLVDLAGSERVAKTGSTGVRKVEGGHINKSLTILTTVISRLTETNSGQGVVGNKNTSSGVASTFVPYRDSRLTHLLKTAIGGNSLTAVFCCITPAAQHVDESRSTLQFAARAKAIKNRVSVNEVSDVKTSLQMVKVELRRYKRMMLATTLYLWSKNVRIKRLQEKLDEFLHLGVAPSPSPPVAAAVVPYSTRMAPNEQQRIIIEQLTRQNELLQQELVEALERQLALGNNPQADAHTATTIGLADDSEKQQLRADVRDLEQMLKETLDEKSAIQVSMDKLEKFCKELEEENAAQASVNKRLQTTCQELHILIDAKESAEHAGKDQLVLLKEQLSKTQANLLEKGRGDEYLQQLTKLHIEHQELQYAHHQIQERHNREMAEADAKIEELRDKIDGLEDETAELREASKLQNSYLWRLLSVASVVSRGKAVNPEETTATVCGAQVDAAVKTLTNFVQTSLEKPPLAAESLEIVHARSQRCKTQDEHQEGNGGKDGAKKDNSKDDTVLLKRIDELQQQLVAKDAQRDITVDSKLKRMQSLVLRLHTTNAALTEELLKSCKICEELFRFVDKHPKLALKLAKTGLVPMSFKAAVDRALQAKIPARPYGHN